MNGPSLRTAITWLRSASRNPTATVFRTSPKNLVSYFLLLHTFTVIFDAADTGNISQTLSLHPVHLTSDEEGNLPPSALIPFCSYQGDTNLLGQERPELDNLTICDKFEETILEGQLCYSLDIAKLGEKRTKSGRTYGLFLLLDPYPYQLNTTDRGSDAEEHSVKIFIHTLAQYATFGPGSYGMSTLKRMTGTKSFEQLPDHQKKCFVHNREDCQTQKYLEHVQKACNCSPWTLQTQIGKNQVKPRPKMVPSLQVSNFCGPEKESCVSKQTLKDKNCLVPCTGLHADIADDSLKQTTQALEQNVIKGSIDSCFAHN